MKVKTSLAALSLLTTTMLADDMEKSLKILPILTDESYTFDFAVAAMGGYQEVHHKNGSGAFGGEISFNCPLVTLPSNVIRQQLSVVRYDKEVSPNNNFEMVSVELNPHVMIDVTEKFRVGAGPGFGVVVADSVKSDVVFGLNAGVSMDYAIAGPVFIGAQVRWQWTTEGEFSQGYETSVDNCLALGKVGIKF